MADSLGQRLCRRFEDLRTERRYYEETWQKIADYELGRRDFTHDGNRTPGLRRDIEIYDNTAQTMASLLASGLHSLLTNPASDWFHLRPIDERLMQDHAVALWLDTVEQILYSAFQLPRGRFQSQIHEVYIDLVAFGTAGLFVSDIPGEPRVLFSARPVNELYIAEDPSGRIDTVIRRFRYTARQAVARWGDRAPEMARKHVKDGNPEDKSDYLHVVMPAEDPIRMPLTGEPFAFGSWHVHYETKAVIEQGGYHEMPYMVPRWEVDAGESWGRGPGWNALAASKMSSTMVKTTVQAGEMAARPPVLQDDDGVMTQTALRPGARISVRPSGGLNPPIQPLDFRPSAQIPTALISDTRQQVQEAFLFELLQLIRDPRMTATQVLEISANVQRVLSPILGRVQTELLEPVVNRVYGILSRKPGVFPDPPAVLAQQDLKIEYVSPVVRAQRASDTQAIVDLFTFAANLSQVDASVVDVLDPEEALRFMAAQRGVPITVLKSREQVAKLREAQRDQAMAEQQQQRLLAAAETVQKLGAGSPAG